MLGEMVQVNSLQNVQMVQVSALQNVHFLIVVYTGEAHVDEVMVVFTKLHVRHRAPTPPSPITATNPLPPHHQPNTISLTDQQSLCGTCDKKNITTIYIMVCLFGKEWQAGPRGRVRAKDWWKILLPDDPECREEGGGLRWDWERREGRWEGRNVRRASQWVIMAMDQGSHRTPSTLSSTLEDWMRKYLILQETGLEMTARPCSPEECQCISGQPHGIWQLFQY